MFEESGYDASVRRAARPLVLGFGLGMLSSVVAGSCLVKDEDHCRWQNQSASCTDPEFPYCSSCVPSTDHGGCVKDPPPSDCKIEGDDVAGTSGATGTGGTSDPTLGDGDPTGPVDCTNEGAVDEACDAETPYCLGGTCVACTDGGEGFCAGVDAGLPVCGAAGLCLECSADDSSACEDGEFCSATGVCGGCTSHEQCAPDGCEKSDPDSCQACDFESGECFGGNVYWIDKDTCDGEPFGTIDDPYCTFLEALGNTTNVHEFTVWVTPSPTPYPGPVNLDVAGSNRVAVVGWGGRAVISGSTNAGNVTGPANRLLLSSLVLENGTEETVRCATGRLWLDDVLVRGGPIGVSGEHCTRLTVSGSVVTGADEVGISLEGTLDGSAFAIVNSAVVNNGSGAASDGGITITGVPDWTMVYTTVIGNLRDGGGSALACASDSPGEVRNSILLSGEGSEAIQCVNADVSYSVSDIVDLPGAGNVQHPYFPSEFDNPGVGEAHLRSDPDPDVFRIAVWRDGDPATDVDGDLRPLVDGAPDWAGFDLIPE